jgi:hypothetical protein
MALTTEEQKKVAELKQEGYSLKEIVSYIGGQRTGRTSSIEIKKQQAEDPIKKEELLQKLSIPIGLNIPKPEGMLETVEDVAQTGKGVLSQFKQAGEDIYKTITSPELSFGEKLRGGLSRAFSGGSRAIVGEPIKGAIKMQLTPEQENRVKQGISDVATEVANTELAKNIITKYQALSPDAQREINNALGFAEGLADIGTAGLVGRFTKPILESVEQMVSKTAKPVVDTIFKDIGSIFPVGKTYKSIDEVVSDADTTLKQLDTNLKQGGTSEIRRLAEEEAVVPNLQERWIGIDPDIKKQIQGKPELMQDYINVVQARNLDMNVPSVYEYAGDFARQATDKMEEVLNNTGNMIGQARQKFGTYKANTDQIKSIESAFKQELDNLGLQVNIVGNITQKPNAIRKYGSTKDISALSDMWLELQTLKESPTLTNLIDYRNFVQKNIDFGKSAREISDALDQPSKRLRAKVKEVAAGIVGKSEAKRLDDYTNFIEAFNDIKSYTDRRAGGEYLLRVALSGRGGEARSIINTIKEYTGIDLMDHATMMSITTDLLANSRQKNLFRQEITNAGVDVARILAGDPRGAIPILGKFLQDKLFNPEEVLLEAAGKSFNGAKPQTSLVGKILGKDIPNKEGGFVKIGKETDNLLQEAKKYKSAEEFVKKVENSTEGIGSVGKIADSFNYKKTDIRPQGNVKYTKFSLGADAKYLQNAEGFGDLAKTLKDEKGNVFIYLKDGTDPNKLNKKTLASFVNSNEPWNQNVSKKFITNDNGQTWKEVSAFELGSATSGMSKSQLEQIWKEANKSK